MIPEKIKHGKKLSYPYKILFVFLRKIFIYAYLKEVIEKSYGIHNTSSIISVPFFFLIVFVGYFSSRTDFEICSNSSV